MISRLRRAWAWLLAQLAAVEDGAPVAFMRIAVGAALLTLVVPFVCTATGREIVRFSFVDDDFGGYRDFGGTAVMRWLGGPTATTVFTLLTTSMVAGVLMVLGLFGRLPIFVAAVCTRIVFLQNPDVSGGGDALLGNALFLMLLANSTHTLSLDCRWRTGRFVDSTPVNAWPRKVALVQLALIYTSTGLQKLVSTTWTPLDGFSALYQILQSPQWARFPNVIEATDGWLVVPLAVATAMTIVWECSFWLVLVKKSWRPVFAVVGVGIHIGIIVLMEVGIFSWLSMALYPAMFPLASAHLAGLVAARIDPLPDRPPTATA